MKYLLSKTELKNINTFEDCEPQAVEILDDYTDVANFLSFKATTGGYASVDAYLQQEPFFIYKLDDGKRIASIGH